MSNNIQDELRDLNSDLPGNNNPFSVPEGYFDGLAGSVLARVKQGSIVSAQDEIRQLSPLLSGISRKMPYEIPAGYFESSAEALPFIIEGEEKEVLSFIKDKTMPLYVPSEYFNELPGTVLSKVAPAKARVIQMTHTNWKRMAVAVMVTAIMSITGIFYLFSPHSSSKDPIAQVRNASTNDIEAFLSSTGASLSGVATAKNSLRNTEINSMIQNVPDNEMDAFLKQVPDEESITN